MKPHFTWPKYVNDIFKGFFYEWNITFRHKLSYLPKAKTEFCETLSLFIFYSAWENT